MTFSSFLVFIALGAVAVVLCMGLWTMLRGKDPHLSQKLMQWRVMLQFAALVILMAFVYFSAK